MSQEQFIENFLSAADFLEPVEVTMETELCGLPGWDSIAALAVIVMFDMEYGKTITGENLRPEQTLGGLYKLTGL